MTTFTLPVIAHLLNSRRDNAQMPSMVYMTDEERAPNPIPTIKKLKPGSGVIFRHYNIKSRFNLGQEIKSLCQKKKLLFIVGGDSELAQILNADGLHLPEYMVMRPSLRTRIWRKRSKKIMTASVHCEKSLLKCVTLSVDAALVSSVFPTDSHLNQTTLGVLKFQKLAYNSQAPIYALGGINNKNAIQLINSPAIGIAGISAISQTLGK